MSGFYPSLLKFFSGNMLLTAVNVVRDMSIAAAFGAVATDHFFQASALIVFMVTVAGAACRSVHVPVLQRAAVRSGTEYDQIARRLVAVMLRSVLAGGIGLALLAWVGTQAAGFAGNQSLLATAKIALYVAPMYALSAFVEVSQGILQTRHRILAPTIMRLGLPLGIVGGALLGKPYLGVDALAAGGLVGGALGAAGIAYLLAREGFWTISAPTLPDAVGKVVRGGLLTLTISSCIAYINPVVDLWMAGLLGPGSTTILGYASRLTVGLSALLVGSFAPVFLHQFSRFIAAGDTDSLQRVYSHFVAFAPWLGACMTVGTWLVSGVVAPLFFQRGSFSPDDARTVATIIDVYAFQFPFFLTCTVGFTLISALAHTHVFIRINAILLVSNLVADITLMRFFGLRGLALTTTIVYAISLLSLNFYLWRAGSARADAHSIRGGLLALLTAAVALVLIRRGGLQLTPASAPASWLAAALLLAAMVGVGLVYNWPRIAAYRLARRAA